MSENHQPGPSVLQPYVDRYFHNDTANRYTFDQTFKNKTLDPERALLLAVLQDAIDRRDTEWFNRPGYEPYGFSFEYVCEHLGFEPDWIRGGVLRQRGQDPSPGSSSAPDSLVLPV